MLPIKLDLTEELAATLRQLRLDHPVNGEVLTAENLSKAIGNNRAWMSQIESRRLKKIRREDIIAIYKVLYDETDDYKAEYRAELDLEKFYIDINTMLSLNSNKDLEDKLGYKFIPPESDEYYNKQSFSFIMDSLNDVLSEKFFDLLKSGDTEEQGDFLHLISLFMGDMHSAYDDTKIFLGKLPLDLLQYATVEEREDILSKLDYIYNMLVSFDIRYTEHHFNERVANHKSHITFTKDSQSLMYGLVELSRLIKEHDKIDGSIIEYINDFIDIIKKYYLSENIPIPIMINDLDENSQMEDWLNTIDKLQLLLSDSKDSHYFIRGKLTDNKSTR